MTKYKPGSEKVRQGTSENLELSREGRRGGAEGSKNAEIRRLQGQLLSGSHMFKN